MSAREIVFLGTASQVPTRLRNHNSLFLFWDDLGILFDPGEGTQRQLTMAGISTMQITHIAITHFHGDHCLGLAGVIQRLSLDRVPHTVEVIYPASGQVFFERLRYASIYYDVANIQPRPIAGDGDAEIDVGQLGKARLTAQRLDHGVDCFGYRLQEEDGRRMMPEALAAAGVRGAAIGELTRKGSVVIDGRTVHLDDVSQPRPGQSFALVMDTRPCPGASRLAEKADLLVCESTYLHTEAVEAHDHRHMTAKQSAELAKQADARRLVLTHFSQRYSTPELFAQEASAVHSDIAVAEDLLRVAVPKRRE